MVGFGSFGIFFKACVDVFRVFPNIEFGKLLVSNVDDQSTFILVTNLMSFSHTIHLFMEYHLPIPIYILPNVRIYTVNT